MPQVGVRPALFCLFSNELSVVAVRHFVRALGEEQPVVSLMPPRMNGRFDRARSIENLGLELLADIREHQSCGPYYLCGHSLGGLLAYEVAGQLRLGGEEVAWLGLLDTLTPVAMRLAVSRQLQLGTRIRRFKARARVVGLPAATWELGARRIERLRVRLGQPPPADSWDSWGAYHLIFEHRVVGHDVPLDLFTTDPGIHLTSSAQLGWEKVHRGALRCHMVPGDHGSLLLEPQVDHVLRILVGLLAEAQEVRTPWL